MENLEDRRLLSAGAVNGGLLQSYGRLPLSFEANRGQADGQVQFLSRGAGYAVFVTPTEAVLSLKGPAATGAVLRMDLVGATSTPRGVGLDRLPGVSNYLIGNDPSRWHADVPNYARVQEQGVYPGVDLTYYGNQRSLEYDFTVAPGADPGAIRLAFSGAESTTIDAQGNLVLHTSGGDVVEQAPVLYQEAGGVRQAISGHYVIGAEGQVRFSVGAYDARKALIVDPTISYSTFLGGNNTDEGTGIAVDSAGNAYVIGTAQSTDFPTATPIQSRPSGSSDAFVTKLNAAGTALIYSTYLGGGGDEDGTGIALDAAGNAYVTGTTSSPDFPTRNPIQSALGGGAGNFNAYLAELNATGSALVYSTYLGGSGGDRGLAIAVDTGGNAYVTGSTRSPNFPTKDAYQPASPNRNGGLSAFVTKVNSAGSALVYSTYLGGNGGDDIGKGIAVDIAGEAYVTGYTETADFPTVNPIQSTNKSRTGGTAFLTKFNAAGSALLYSTYLGGTRSDQGLGVAVDAAGNAYITGATDSFDFPTKNPIQPALGNGNPVFEGDTVVDNAFVAKVNPAGSALVYSTYLGGSGGDGGHDFGAGIAVNAAGEAYVTGRTSSPDFPTFSPSQTFAGNDDAFVAKLNAAGSALVYSTYFGGRNEDSGAGIALDAVGNAYITGSTQSASFPVTPGAFQTTKPLGPNQSPFYLSAFVAKFLPAPRTNSVPTIVFTTSPNPSDDGQSITYSVTVTKPAGAIGTPTGRVTIKEGATLLATLGLNTAGKGGVTQGGLPLGTHTITATYSGDPNFPGSSATITQTVRHAPVVSNTTVDGTPNPAFPPGTLVTVTAFVSSSRAGAGVPTGVVTFREGASTLATGTLRPVSAGVSEVAEVEFNTSSLSLGSHIITATYGGDANFPGSTGSYTQVIATDNRIPTTTTLTVTPNDVTLDPINVPSILPTITVRDSVGGDVPSGKAVFVFDDDPAFNLTQQDVVDGVARFGFGPGRFGVGAYTAGTHTVVVMFSQGQTNPDGSPSQYQGSTSSTATYTVRPTLTASAKAARSGQPVTFTSIVSVFDRGSDANGTVTALGGTVTFTIDGKARPPVPVTQVANSDGFSKTSLATLTLTDLPAGPHLVVATFSGRNVKGLTSFGPATSAPLALTVSPAGTSATTTKVASSPNPSAPGQAVTLRATVARAAGETGVPTGSVTFLDGTTTLGTRPIAAGPTAGLATFTTSALGLGSHAITARYLGDARFAASSGMTTETVRASNPVPTTTTLTAASDPSAVGQAVTFTAAVNIIEAGVGGGASDTVTFTIDGVARPPVPIRVVNGHGRATLTTATLAAGPHKVVAAYSGSSEYRASTSTTLTQTVNRAALIPTVTVLATPPPSAVGRPVTFAATVTRSGAGTPTGSVTFREGSAVRKVVTLDAAGRASFVTTALSTGTHAITADYSGDARYGRSSSTTTVVIRGTVTPAADLAITLAVAPDPAPAGHDLTYTLTVVNHGPNAATGVVVLDTLPVGFRELSLTYDRRTSVGAVLAGNVVRADLGTVAPGERAMITIVARPPGAGTFTATARARANEADPTPANNTTAITGTVLAPPPPIGGDGPRVTGLVRYGFHAQPTIFVIAFDGPLDPARAQDPANYALAGPVGGLGRVGPPITIARAIYDPSKDTVTLLPARSLNVHHRYTLTIHGTGPLGVAAPAGVLLDGAGTGQAGSDYVTTFGRSILVGPARAYPVPIQGAVEPAAARKPAAAAVDSRLKAGALRLRAW